MMMLHEQMVVEIIEWGSVSQHYLLNTSWFVHMPSFRCKWTRRSCLRQFLISSVKMWRRKKNREENRIISTQQGHKPTTTCDRIPSRRESRAPRQSPASHTHTRFNNSRGLGPAATVSALWRAAPAPRARGGTPRQRGHQTLPRASLAVSPPRRWHLRAQATAAPSHRSPGRTYATAGAWGGGGGGAYVRATRRGYSCSSSCGFSPTARVVCGLACADTLVHGTRLHVLDEWRVRRVDQVLGVEGGRVLRYYAILWNMCGSDHVSDLFSF